MLQTVIVYFLLIVVMMYLSYIGRAKEKWKYMIYAIIAYSIVFGIRYGVGVDFFSYLHNYNAYTTTTGHWGVSKQFEIGFGLITEIIADLKAHYTIYFGVIAFLQLYFTLLAFKKEYKLYPYLVFSFMVSCYWLTYSNGLRQIMAMSIWIWAIKFLAEKKTWQFCLSILLAFTMHTSAIVLLIFYPIYNWKQEWFKDIRLQIALIVFSLILMKVDIVQSLMQNFDTIIQLTKYDDYTQEDQAINIHKQVKLGLGYAITLFLILLLVFNSNKTKQYFKSKLFNIYYDLFFIGACLKYILINSLVFTRVNYYFIHIMFIVAAYTLRYAHKNNKTLFYLILSLILFTFVATLYGGFENTAVYVFFWQKDLYYLKFK